MKERFAQLLPEAGPRVPVMTFHALGLTILQEQSGLLDLPPDFRVADDRQRTQLLVDHAGLSERQAGRLLAEISRVKRGGDTARRPPRRQRCAQTTGG
jgi:DNA helicase II / ATP-dependent DNA helicase PcrA